MQRVYLKNSRDSYVNVAHFAFNFTCYQVSLHYYIIMLHNRNEKNEIMSSEQPMSGLKISMTAQEYKMNLSRQTWKAIFMHGAGW